MSGTETFENLRIAVTSGSFSKHPKLVENIRLGFPHTELNTSEKKFDRDSLVTYLSKVDGAVVGLEKIDDALLEKCPKLKFIAKFGVGLDNIDFDACKRRGVKVGYTKGVNALSVAEEALAFLLSLSRNLYPSSILLKKGTWEKRGGSQLSGKTVGIIGVGHIGKELIRLLAPFKCKILVNDIVDQAKFYKENGVTEVTKEVLFRESDFITLHVPLSNETRYLINRETLNLMKPTAIVVNTSRGSIVNQADLKQALLSKRIRAAALDVYEEEPPTDIEFLTLPNLFCTPHIGGNAEEAVMAMGLSAIHHMRTFAKELRENPQ